MQDKDQKNGFNEPDGFFEKHLSEIIKIFRKSKVSAYRKQVIWEGIESKLDNPAKNQFPWMKLGLAASVSLLMAFFTYQFIFENMDSMESLADLSDVELVTETQLILSESETLLLENDESDLDYSDKGQISINQEKSTQTSSEYNTLIVPYGKKSKVTLEDGTRVWVNSGSKLIYPVAFSQKERKLYIEGEAFFEVAPDASRPFLVQSKNMDLKVLGTSFNLSSYANEPTVSAVLVTGSVELTVDKKSLFNKKKQVLKPHERAVFGPSTGELRVKPVDIEYYVAWKEGYMKLRKSNLNQISQKLQKFYNVKIELADPSIGEETFTGKLDLKQDLEEVLEILTATTSLKFTKNERRYLLMK
ncbi:FecR family protein [Litoribacter populi]|uniref:FecR family protein n=1 Tax=Litoribacter populi TaxID=2598460 RepID=UPI00117D8DAE|nr:FecR domain-containing protein [Litoribacter populi]